ncbi:Gas41 [Strongyloides ratti]|uniref:Gas41 n=1 Tax=Strongyloides ratti TaxID=34506 RepID=A0A090KWT3_STRRB|nr:Gas41 [Strongyloides ratti]CEF61970.1 Gas41 [Strongyloides ratti]
MDYNIQERKKGFKIIKPIIIGNIAKPLDEPITDTSGKSRTHEWTIFVKPYLNEDISKYVKKVQFKLHESYENNVKVVDSAPFQVCETCWAESEVMIKIFFVDTAEKPVTLYHYVRIREDGATFVGSDGTVAAEHYDELIFKEPSALMERCLVEAVKKNELHNNQFRTNFEDIKRIQMDQIVKARETIRREIDDLKKSIIDGQELLRIKSEELQNILNSKEDEIVTVKQEEVK